ncbi:hypothetical protein GOODEAATRI_022811, partial [Goodea atripinnis]
VGGSMRPWKRAFSVLRHHSLFLYKDKREAVLHGAGAGSSQDEHPPVNIRGCLIDIAYSETKRKHTLRLTTQGFCEFLLQAEDRDDMLAWIRVIRENSKTDNEVRGISSQRATGRVCLGRHQISSSSKKDLNAKDFLPKSIISAVTRKRKKCLSTHLPVSSGDEDSEHEAVKNTDYTEVVGGGTQEVAQGEHTCSKKEKRQGEEHVVASAEGTGGKEEIEKAVRKGVDREIRQRSSLLCSPQQSHATYPKPPAAIGQPSHVKIQSEAKERPNIPFWISPSRPPIPQASSYHSSQQADRSRAIPVCCRKTGGGWTRASSINLELELDRCKEKVRDQRPELVRTGEVLVAQCGNIQQGSVVDAGSTHQIDPLPTFPSPSGWIDQSSSSVVLRRSTKGSQAKTRAWRRHTVVI